MPLFQQNKNIEAEVEELRSQGLTDTVIMDELTKKGYKAEEVHQAISQESGVPQPAALPESQFAAPAGPSEEIYGRTEELVESMIDEKWDELLAEVKKIVEWKSRIEGNQTKLANDFKKLKEDFKVLHQAVLGKLGDYDERMMEVGTELKAVGKVFKDVVPEFVENVKELSNLTEKVKRKKKKK